LFKSAGMALIGSVGGAAGRCRTLFLRMAAEADGKAELAEKDVVAMFRVVYRADGTRPAGPAQRRCRCMGAGGGGAGDGVRRRIRTRGSVHRMAQAAKSGMIATCAPSHQGPS